MGWSIFDSSGQEKQVISTNFSNLGDVDVAGPVDGQLMRYSGSIEKWENFDPQVLSATQSSLISSANDTEVDIPGCSLSLSSGRWLVVGNFGSARFWVNDASGTVGGNILYAIRNDSSYYDRHLARQSWTIVGGAQRNEFPYSMSTIIDLGTTTTVKLSGYCNLTSGTNFASGFRIDSGAGFNSTIRAVRLS